MIIDMHVHIFPDAIAERASEGIANFYELKVRYDGKLSTMFELGQRAGIEKYLVHSVATTPRQVRSINDYLAGAVNAHPDQLVGFMTVHPDLKHMEEEIDRALKMGLRGVKIHPDIQQVSLNDPRFYRLFEIIQGRIPLLTHMGDPRYDYSHPRRMARVLDDFPRLTAICAHFGGWMCWDDAEKELAGRDVYVDTCSSFKWLTPERATEIVRAFSADRVLFGTDYPMWDPATEVERLNRLRLTDAEKEKIFSRNALALLK